MGLTQIAQPYPQFTVGNMGPICLIIPSSSFLLDERVFMSLGILRIAAVLEQSGIVVHVLDLSGFKNFTSAAADYAE